MAKIGFFDKWKLSRSEKSVLIWTPMFMFRWSDGDLAFNRAGFVWEVFFGFLPEWGRHKEGSAIGFRRVFHREMKFKSKKTGKFTWGGKIDIYG